MSTLNCFPSTFCSKAPASDSPRPHHLEGFRAGEGSFLRRKGSFGGRSKITHTPTSDPTYQQLICPDEYIVRSARFLRTSPRDLQSAAASHRLGQTSTRLDSEKRLKGQASIFQADALSNSLDNCSHNSGHKWAALRPVKMIARHDRERRFTIHGCRE